MIKPREQSTAEVSSVDINFHLSKLHLNKHLRQVKYGLYAYFLFWIRSYIDLSAYK